MNDNERPTPLTDAAEYSYTDQDGIEQYVVKSDFAHYFERSLAERTEERDKLLEKQSWLITHPTAIEAAHQVVEWTKCEQDRDAALAKLAKCREALESIAEYWNGHSNERAMQDACEHNANRAQQTLEETKPQ